MKKIYVITHRDMDGAGGEIILRNVFSDSLVVSESCTYKNVYETVNGFVNSSLFHDYDRLYITDLSSEGFHSTRIGNLLDNPEEEVYLFDHHPHSTNIENYSNVFVDTECSATKRMFDLYDESNDLSHLNEIVDLINRYDTYTDVDAQVRALNYLYYHYWHDRFVRRFSDGSLDFMSTEQYIIERKEEELRTALDSINVEEFCGGRLLIGTGKNHINEICNYLLDSTENAKVVCLINPKSDSVSVRTGKDVDLDAGEVCSALDGGGHPNAAGFNYGRDKVDKLIEEVDKRLSSP